MTMPDRVTGAASTAFAMPKSVIFTLPDGVTMMLPGFTSRCTRPRSWAACNALPVCSSRSIVTSAVSRPREMIVASGSPSTSSITRYAVSSGPSVTDAVSP